jgi:drug/metabolite transporter (DMT)-like permease
MCWGWKTSCFNLLPLSLNPPEDSHLDPQAYPYILFLGIMFGTTLLASRFSVSQYNPMTYLGLRLTIAALGHVIVYTFHFARRRWPHDRRLWKHAIVLGVLGTALPMTCIVFSLQYLSGGMASILITANPAVTVLLANFLLDDEPLSWRKGIGVVFAICGAVLLVVLGETGLPDVESSNPIGYVLVMTGMVVSSVMVIYVRKFMRDFEFYDVASARMIVASLTVMPLSLLLVGFDLSNVDRTGYLALLYAAIIGTFIAMVLQFYNIQRFGATAAVMVAYVIPVVTTIGGVLLLGEQVTVGMLGSMVLIAIGVWQINRGSVRMVKTLPL